MELPRVEVLYQEFKDRGFKVVAVEALQDRERATKFIADKKLTFVLLENGKGETDVVRRLYGVGTFPTSFLIDRQGRVQRSHLGFEPGAEAKMRAEIEQMLGS